MSEDLTIYFDIGQRRSQGELHKWIFMYAPK